MQIEAQCCESLEDKRMGGPSDNRSLGLQLLTQQADSQSHRGWRIVCSVWSRLTVRELLEENENLIAVVYKRRNAGAEECRWGTVSSQ